jgi:hypothetical protein
VRNGRSCPPDPPVSDDGNGRVGADDPSFPQPKRPPLVLHIDAADADWLKPDVRIDADGVIYVRDLSVAGGTRRVGPGDEGYEELRARVEGERGEDVDCTR